MECGNHFDGRNLRCCLMCFRKVSQNCIHLTEVSQDLHLYGNKLRLILDHVKVLPNVSIHETADSVCIIIATTLSVFRLSWPHPVKDKEVGIWCLIDVHSI